jgi:hypothetical protein
MSDERNPKTSGPEALAILVPENVVFRIYLQRRTDTACICTEWRLLLYHLSSQHRETARTGEPEPF